jgi:hypothetical protein
LYETKAINEAQYSAADASEFSSINRFNFTARKDDNDIFYDLIDKHENEKSPAKLEKNNNLLDFFRQSEYNQPPNNYDEEKAVGNEKTKEKAKVFIIQIKKSY